MGTTLRQFLDSKNPNGIFTIIKWYWNHLLEFIYTKEVSNKVDNWKGVKIKSSEIPEGWTSQNAFKFLEKEYEGKTMKRFAD